MGPQKDVVDIVTELGGVKTPEAAQEVFEDKLDAVNLSKLNEIKNEAASMNTTARKAARYFQP